MGLSLFFPSAHLRDAHGPTRGSVLPGATLAARNGGRELLKFGKGPQVIVIPKTGVEKADLGAVVSSGCFLVTPLLFPIFSPLQGGALLGGVNALHTAFPENPLKQYQRQCELILEKLELHDLLSEELRRLER